jgi:translation initiation factor IF-1
MGQLKNEIVAKIRGKSDVLMRLRDGDNVLQIEGYNQYRNTDKWNKLR